jgi:hypothetical protein
MAALSKIMFRAPPSLKREIEEAAQQNSRTASKEIAHRLNASFSRARRRKQAQQSTGPSEARP